MNSGYVLLTEKEEMWARMLMEVLEDNDIPCAAEPVYGAGFTVRTGVKEWLKISQSEDGKVSNLVIFDNCHNLIRCLPQLKRDAANPNDVDSKTNHELTHGPDALRYFLAGRPAPATVKTKPAVYNFKSERERVEIDKEEFIYL